MRIWPFIILVLLIASLLNVNAFAAAERTAEQLPEFELPVPDEENHRTYLGLESSSGTFSVGDIEADIVLIELFSMYCPFCQEEAPLINELYELMNEQSESGPSVKIIGIGASNSEFEVDHFRTTYNVQFPMFPDQDMAIYKALSGAGTPGFVGVRLSEGEAPLIVLRQSGGFHSKENFLGQLIEFAE
jgi:thiol-disulfide isomerase/thioredoxin